MLLLLPLAHFLKVIDLLDQSVVDCFLGPEYVEKLVPGRHLFDLFLVLRATHGRFLARG